MMMVWVTKQRKKLENVNEREHDTNDRRWKTDDKGIAKPHNDPFCQ